MEKLVPIFELRGCTWVLVGYESYLPTVQDAVRGYFEAYKVHAQY